MKIIHQEVKLDLAWSKAIVKKDYDQKRGNHLLLKKGDHVYLRRRTIGKREYNIKTNRRSLKFDCLKIGPYEVLDKLENDNFKLKLPPRLRIHPTFHVSLLEKTKNPVSDENDSTYGEEYEVERILGRRVSTTGMAEYLIQWKGYEESENSWERVTNLFCPELIQEFEQNKAQAAHDDGNER
jgi:hypothetical protein